MRISEQYVERFTKLQDISGLQARFLGLWSSCHQHSSAVSKTFRKDVAGKPWSAVSRDRKDAKSLGMPTPNSAPEPTSSFLTSLNRFIVASWTAPKHRLLKTVDTENNKGFAQTLLDLWFIWPSQSEELFLPSLRLSQQRRSKSSSQQNVRP